MDSCGGNRRRGASENGSALLLALLILGALSVLASAAIVVSTSDRNLARYDRETVQALAAAETGVAMAKRAIIDRTATLTDYDSDGRPDFELTDSLSWGGGYHVIAETSDIRGMGITAYQSNGFTILSEGSFLTARRRVKMEIVHDSFLKFARFVSQNTLSYACDAQISGEVYSGADLDVPCGCSSGRQVRFLESVYVVGEIPNSGCADFFRGYVTDADTIDLSNSFNWTDMRNRSRGLAADNACERRGSVGIYISLNGTDPLQLHTTSPIDVLVLDRFDFNNTALFPPDTVVTYNGSAVINTVTGVAMRKDEFNGIVFWEGAAKLQGGTRGLDGVAGRNLTLFATSTITCMTNITTGHTGFDPDTRLPDGSGNPVNLGLVAETYIAMASGCPKVMRVDAALLSRTSNWRGLGDTNSHPTCTGPLDLDLDGIVGETPHNNDPAPGEGWNEAVINADTWVLNLNGPIITRGSGDANPWNNSGVIDNAGGPTRRYNYDLDMTEFPPPCFPVPLNLWKDVSWTEIFDVHSDLAGHLPN